MSDNLLMNAEGSVQSFNLDELYEAVLAAEKHSTHNKWLFYEPYPKQQEFMDLGATYKERLLIAGNQTGKSDCGGYETARHLTGVYPPWWKGLRYDQNTGPCPTWVGGTSGMAVRDGAQKKLFGEPGVGELFGTGFIPKESIIGDPSSSRSATNAIDTAHIRHISGGVSTIGFKTYSQVRTDWQGPTKNFIWFDEEPPMDIYTEGLARLAATGGSHILTFTPLLGFSDVVKRFLECEPQFRDRRVFIQMAMTDAKHMTPDLIKAALSMYPENLWKARMDGDPYMAGGAVFSSASGDLKEPDFAMMPGQPGTLLPGHWAFLWGVDLLHSGGDQKRPGAHCFAAVLMAYDREMDHGHLLAGFKTTDGNPLQHAHRIRQIAANVPIAWPHDGNVKDIKGDEYHHIYRSYGLNMLSEHAKFREGGYSTEAGITELDVAMREGRFHVNERMTDWFQEYGLYHRSDEKGKEGKIVKVNDDLLSATRIVWMMRRAARTVPLGSKISKPPRQGSAKTINPFTGKLV